MSRKLKPIPAFRNEMEERQFWKSHSSSDYVDWSKAQRARFPNLKPSTASISLRLPLTLLERIKIAANKRDMPYQSLIKAWLAEKVETKRGLPGIIEKIAAPHPKSLPAGHSATQASRGPRPSGERERA